MPRVSWFLPCGPVSEKRMGKECLVMVGALNLKTKPAQFWTRDGGQDNRAETRDRGDTGAGEEQLLEEPNRRGLIRAEQVPRAQANPSSESAGRKRKVGALSRSSLCS